MHHVVSLQDRILRSIHIELGDSADCGEVYTIAPVCQELRIALRMMRIYIEVFVSLALTPLYTYSSICAALGEL